MQNPNLHRTQKLLWRLIAWPEGVPDALKHFKETRLPVKGDARLSAVQRVDIYANMYFYRILDALKEDFASILRLIGDARFHNLATHYLAKYPSTHYSLRYAGSKMAQFLKTYPLRKKWPYLSELAKLELTLLDSFDAPDSSVLRLENLTQVAPEEWARLKFKFSPSLQLLPFDWNVLELREGTLKNGKGVKPVRKKNWVRFWRKDFKVYYQGLAPLGQSALSSLVKGKNFEAVCASIAKKTGPDRAPLLVAQHLKTWIEEGLVAGFSVG